MRLSLPAAVVLTLALPLCGPARAVDVPVTAEKLIVVDELVRSSRAKAVFVSKDPAIAKGDGTDATAIAATLEIAWDGDAVTAATIALNAVSLLDALPCQAN